MNDARAIGTKRGRLTTAEENVVISLAERGLTSGQIARKLDRHPGTINWAMHRLGVAETKFPKRSPYMRAGKMVVPFSRDEDAFIQACRIAGHPMSTIATAAGNRFGHTRGVHTIRCRLIMLANAPEPVT